MASFFAVSQMERLGDRAEGLVAGEAGLVVLDIGGRTGLQSGYLN